MDWGT